MDTLHPLPKSSLNTKVGPSESSLCKGYRVSISISEKKNKGKGEGFIPTVFLREAKEVNGMRFPLVCHSELDPESRFLRYAYYQRGLG